MNFFKKDFWLMIGDAFKESFESSSFVGIPCLILSLLLAFPFLLIFSILNLLGVMPDV